MPSLAFCMLGLFSPGQQINYSNRSADRSTNDIADYATDVYATHS